MKISKLVDLSACVAVMMALGGCAASGTGEQTPADTPDWVDGFTKGAAELGKDIARPFTDPFRSSENIGEDLQSWIGQPKDNLLFKYDKPTSLTQLSGGKVKYTYAKRTVERTSAGTLTGLCEVAFVIQYNKVKEADLVKRERPAAIGKDPCIDLDIAP